MSLEPSGPGRRAGRIETGALLRAAFTTVTDRPPHHILAIVGPWILILIVAHFLVALAPGETEMLVSDPETGAEEVAPSGMSLLGFVVQVLGVAASVDIAVKWIRYLVLDEVPQSFAEQRLNGRRWSYFLRSLLLILLLAVPLGLVFIMTATTPDTGQGAMFLVLIGAAMVFAAAYLYIGRFGLYLAGAALGDPRMTLAASWEATRESGMTITLAVLAGLLIVFGPYLIVAAILPAVLLVPVEVFVSVALALISDAIIAQAYTRLVPEPAPGTLVL